MSKQVNHSPLTMSSLEIAELVEVRHDNVKRTIDRLVKRNIVRDPPLEVLEKINNLGYSVKVTEYRVNKRDSYVIVAQLSPEFTGRLVDRWQELEERVAYNHQAYEPVSTLLPAQRATRELQSYLEACQIFNVSTHRAQIEAVKYVRDTTGVDYSNLLIYAPAQEQIPDNEVMLEPTELGQRIGMSARKFNKKLEKYGLQVKTRTGWEPTDEGKLHCHRHSWSRGNKSGYNLKWRADIADWIMEMETNN